MKVRIRARSSAPAIVVASSALAAAAAAAAVVADGVNDDDHHDDGGRSASTATAHHPSSLPRYYHRFADQGDVGGTVRESESSCRGLCRNTGEEEASAYTELLPCRRGAAAGGTTRRFDHGTSWAARGARYLDASTEFSLLEWAKAVRIGATMTRKPALCEGDPSTTSSTGPRASPESQPMHPTTTTPPPHQAFTESLFLESADGSTTIDTSKTGANAVRGKGATEDTAAADGNSSVDDAELVDNAYPNFSRHGRSALLPVYLTPEVYESLRGKRTPSGVTLEDCIRAGVTLPHGAKPPRGLAGVYAGDADSYRVFADLFVPLLRDYHQSTEPRHLRRKQQPAEPEQQQQPQSPSTRGGGVRTGPATTTVGTRRTNLRLQRHQTNLNYSYLVKDTLDPEGEYILYTRMRLARSISGFRFPPCIRRGERRRVEQLFKDVVKDWPGRYVSVMDMSNSQHDHLIQQQLLFKDPDEFLLTAGFGRDWPDARGIYCDTWQDTPNIIIWCNAEDHLWIISHGRGGNVQGVFTELSKAVGALETALKERNKSFVEDAKYGFLNASPANIGTALRASVYVKLVRLSRHPGFFDLVARLRLEARSDYSQTDRRFTGIYDIANAEALGKSEVDLINIMIRGVGFLIELEKKLERGEVVDLDTVELPTS